MFRIFLLFLAIVGCEPTNVNFESSIDSSSNYRDLEFDDCGFSIGMNSCNFTFKNERNENISLYDFYGKTIVLDFSTMWCYYCQQAAYDIPETMELFSEEDLVYITLIVENWSGVSPDQDELKEWVDHFGLSSPVLSAPREEILDLNEENGFNVTSWPTFFFIDKEMVINSYIGGYNQSIINSEIENSL